MTPDISRVLSPQRAGVPAERWEGNYSLEALRVSGRERPSVESLAPLPGSRCLPELHCPSHAALEPGGAGTGGQ